MTNYPIRGELRFRSESVREDAAYVRNHVGELSEPKERDVTGATYQWADFGASAEQWQWLEPGLAKRGIMAYLDETVINLMDARRREIRRSEKFKQYQAHKMPPQLVRLCGFAFVVGAAIMVVQYSTIVIPSLICLGGFAVAALGKIWQARVMEEYLGPLPFPRTIFIHQGGLMAIVDLFFGEPEDW